MEHPLLPRVFLTGTGLETTSYTARVQVRNSDDSNWLSNTLDQKSFV